MTSDGDKGFAPLPPLEYRKVWLLYFHDKETYHSQIASDYGKWLLASLLFIHGGGLVGLFTISERDGISSLIPAGITLVIGLMLGLLSGFLTWLNWLLLASSYTQIADYRVLLSESEVFRAPKRSTILGITVTFYATIVLGFASAACIPIAACLVMNRPS